MVELLEGEVPGQLSQQVVYVLHYGLVLPRLEWTLLDQCVTGVQGRCPNICTIILQEVFSLK